VEQQINAIDAMRLGLGVTETSFNLDRLAELPDRLDNAKFRAWLNRADRLLLQTLECVVHKSRPEHLQFFDLEAGESKAV